MKKFLSVALAATVALTTVNMQAGTGAKKAWAYTKIVGGAAALISSVYFSVSGIYNLCASQRGEAALKNLKNEIRNFETFTKKNPEATDKERREAVLPSLMSGAKLYSLGTVRERAHNSTIEAFWAVPLGILAIKSGKRDLRRLKKEIAKKKQAQEKAVAA